MPQLIQQTLDGDKRALNELLAEHQQFIYNVAQKLLLHPDDAQDATQEIMIKIVTSLRSFAGRSSFKTWVYRIAVNHLLNSKKKPTEIRLEGGSADSWIELNPSDQTDAEDYSEELIERNPRAL